MARVRNKNFILSEIGGVMDEMELKEKLAKCGMKSIDADVLIKTAKKNQTSVSRQFIKSLRGLYSAVLAMIVVFIFFTLQMNKEEALIFSFIYFSVILIVSLSIPGTKSFFWSIKVLLKLKGK